MTMPSAFPTLPDDPDRLPDIPGGWREEVVDLGQRMLVLQRPADPDAFLDDQDVVAENSRNDYMPYWAFLWPSSIHMARAVLDANWPPGTRVLELGAGIGLVGLAALARGHRVTFSDHDRTALHLCRLNVRRNGLPEPQLLELDWREPAGETFPVIIGCEVTYDAAAHPWLLELLEVRLATGGECWLGDPGRYQSIAFHERALAAGFEVEIVNRHGELQSKPSTAEFQLFTLRRKKPA